MVYVSVKVCWSGMFRGGSGVGVPSGRGVRVGADVGEVRVAAGVVMGCDVGVGVAVGGLLPQAVSKNSAAAMPVILCNQFMQRHYSIVKRETHCGVKRGYTPTDLMVTLDQFEGGFRLNQYIAHIKNNKENFRANFIKAIECITPDDLAFFRSLPQRVNVAVLTNDASLDALRDVPIISRLCAEVNRMPLRLFDAEAHPEAAQALLHAAQDACTEGLTTLPIIAFFDENMNYIGAQCGPLVALAEEMRRRHLAWANEHPEIRDAREPFEGMSPITRTRLTQVIYAMTPEQRVDWGRKLIRHWQQILATQ
jgi:hypothetical protein